jgi:ribonuclease HII
MASATWRVDEVDAAVGRSVIAAAVILPDDVLRRPADSSATAAGGAAPLSFGAARWPGRWCRVRAESIAWHPAASVRAMRRALARLSVPAEHVLVDGNPVPDLGCEHEAIVGGDNLSLSIAAASVLAKVTRDRLMRALGRRYPAFAWEANKGYATAAHLAVDVADRHHRRS